jgi:hypothetical protein
LASVEASGIAIGKTLNGSEDVGRRKVRIPHGHGDILLMLQKLLDSPQVDPSHGRLTQKTAGEPAASLQNTILV